MIDGTSLLSASQVTSQASSHCSLALLCIAYDELKIGSDPDVRSVMFPGIRDELVCMMNNATLSKDPVVPSSGCSLHVSCVKNSAMLESGRSYKAVLLNPNGVCTREPRGQNRMP